MFGITVLPGAHCTAFPSFRFVSSCYIVQFKNRFEYDITLKKVKIVSSQLHCKKAQWRHAQCCGALFGQLRIHFRFNKFCQQGCQIRKIWLHNTTTHLQGKRLFAELTEIFSVFSVEASYFVSGQKISGTLLHICPTS